MEEAVWRTMPGGAAVAVTVPGEPNPVNHVVLLGAPLGAASALEFYAYGAVFAPETPAAALFVAGAESAAADQVRVAATGRRFALVSAAAAAAAAAAAKKTGKEVDVSAATAPLPSKSEEPPTETKAAAEEETAEKLTERAVLALDAGDVSAALKLLLRAENLGLFFVPAKVLLRALGLARPSADDAVFESVLLHAVCSKAAAAHLEPARAFCETLCRAHPRSAAAAFLLGAVLDVALEERPAAVEHYRAAAAAGSDLAECALAFCVTTLGLQDEPLSAEQLLARASERGNAMATSNLGFLRERQGDFAAAKELYERAARAGNSIAMNNLADMLLLREGKKEEAVRILQEAATRFKSARALCSLGCLRASDPDGEADARKLFEQAAEQDNPRAQFMLAKMLNASDPREATRLLCLAAASGYEPARALIAKLRKAARDARGSGKSSSS